MNYLSKSLFLIFCNKRLKKSISNTCSRIAKQPILALFLPLILLLSGPYLKPAHLGKHSFQSTWSAAENPYLTQNQSDWLFLHSRSLTPRRKISILCPTGTEEVENEEFADKKKQTDDEYFSSGGWGLYKNFYYQIASGLFGSSLKRLCTFQEHFPDQFSNKRYILIRVFRI